MKRTWQTRVAAIVAIAVIEVAALQAGMNGVMMSLSIGAIAGIAGYSLGRVREAMSGAPPGGRGIDD